MPSHAEPFTINILAFADYFMHESLDWADRTIAGIRL